VVYLVSVTSNETKRVEHCILKVDAKAKAPRDGLPLLDEAIAADAAFRGSSESLTPELLILKGDLLLAQSRCGG
jgi:hypothetical protein